MAVVTEEARMSPNCPPHAAASAYIDGELGATERARFEGHLQRCPACSHLVSELRALQDAFRVLPDPTPGFDLRPLIHDRLTPHGRDPVAPRRTHRLGLRLAGAVATLGSLAGGFVLGLSLAVSPAPVAPARPATMAVF